MDHYLRLQDEIELIRRFDNVFINDGFNVKPKKSIKASIEARKKGNAIYSDKNREKNSHSLTLLYYSKSIALAPNQSQELALAYGNRSALLLRLKKYKECLNDVETAYRITDSSELKDKLIRRKAECLSMLNNLKESDKNSVQKQIKNFKIPKFIPSKKFPCASESLSLKYNEQYGRHIVALRDIKPGEIIIKEKNYINFPKPDWMYIICNHCMRFTWTGIPCGSCAVVIYCSEKCKNDAWQEYHDVECSVLPFLYLMNAESPDTIFNVMALRLFIKTVKKEGLSQIEKDVKLIDNSTNLQLNGFFQDGIFQSNKFKSFYNLLSSKECSKTMEERNEVVFSLIIDLLHKQSNILNDKMDSHESKRNDEIKSFIEKLLIKSKKIIELNYCKELDTAFKGITIAPYCSLLNHSCYPNSAKLINENGEIVFYTLRPIKKGEQVYDGYNIFVNTPREIRQMHLKTKYYFTCYCQPCREFWPHRSDMFLMQENFSTLYELTSGVGNISRDLINFFFYNPVENWPCDKETVEKVIKIRELISKNCTSYKAFSIDYYFMMYIHINFTRLLGLKWDIRDNC